MYIKNTNQPAFKWNIKTHIGMTLLAAKDSRLNPEETKLLARYAVMPDLVKNEAGYHHNTHFFFPYGKDRSFGRGGNEMNNALERFKSHFQMALSAHKKQDFLKHTGYAMHFLQDVSMPMHTESGGLIQKMRDYYLHKSFECGKEYGASPALSKLTAGYKPNNISFSSLLDLFVSTAEFSQKPQFKVNRFNKNNWYKIQQQCFNRGIDASREFLEKMLRAANF